MRTAAAVLLTFALTACADPAAVRPGADPAPSSSPPGPSYAADAVVLQVSYGGGLLPPDHLPDPPYWTLYGDGRVVTRGPEPAIYPGRALPSLIVGRVEAETVDRIVAAARAAGIDGEPRDYGDPPVADASTTTFRLATADGYVEAEVYALQEASADDANEARRKVTDFHRRLTAAEADGGFGAVSDEEAYVPTALAVVARTPYDLDSPDVREQTATWEGPALSPGHDVGRAGTCTVVTGDALAAVLPEVRDANTLTRWRYDGADWHLRFRPLLPDERTCADAYPA